MAKDFENIINEYGYIRHKNLLKYEEKKKKIYEEHPELKKYDEEIVSLYVKQCLADSGETSVYDDKISLVKKERDSYLKSHNIKDDYLEVEYNCEKCKDTGYIDGKKCDCLTRKEIERFNDISSFGKLIEKDNFDNINMKLYNQPVKTLDGMRDYKDYMRDVVLHIKEQIKNIDNEPYNAIFIGATGTGKSFLAHCIGAELVKKNKSVLCLNINEYLEALMPNYEGEDIQGYAISCDLLILDDLGTENQTEFTNTRLNYIIDKRLNENKSTIITTNYTPAEIKNKYLQSMASRITSIYRKYLLNGEDLRRITYANV